MVEIVYYTVQSGDSLSAIAMRTYGKATPDIVAEIAAMNTSITDPNLIRPGDMLALPEGPGLKPGTFSSTEGKSVAGIGHQLKPLAEDERGLLATLLAQSPRDIATEVFFDEVNRRMLNARSALKQMTDNYEALKAGDKTRGAYNYARTKAIRLHDQSLGVLRGLTYGPKKTGELLRIQRGATVAATSKIDGAVQTVRRTAALAKTGTVVLGVVNLGTACAQIAEAPDDAARNGIVVETAGGMLGGAAAAAVGVMLFGTPAGWVAIGVMAIAASTAGAAAGFGSRKFYDRFGNGVDIAGTTRISNLCSDRTLTTIGNIPAGITNALR